MIQYTFKFEELEDGSFVVTYDSPPTVKSTLKEQVFCTKFAEHFKRIFTTMGYHFGDKFTMREEERN